MRIPVTGSRSWTDAAANEAALDEVLATAGGPCLNPLARSQPDAPGHRR